jgi:flagellar hook-length control protein FliK
MAIAAPLLLSGPANGIASSSMPGLARAGTGNSSKSSQQSAIGYPHGTAAADWEESRQAPAGASSAFRHLVRRSWPGEKNAAAVPDGKPGDGSTTAAAPQIAHTPGWSIVGLSQFPIAAASGSETEAAPEVAAGQPLHPRFFAPLLINAPAPETAFAGQDSFITNRQLAGGKAAGEAAGAAGRALHAVSASSFSFLAAGVEPKLSPEKEAPTGKTGGTEADAPPAAGKRTETAPLPAQAQSFAFSAQVFPPAAPSPAAPQAGAAIPENQPTARILSAQSVDSFPADSLLAAFTLQAQRQEAPGAATGQVIRSEAAKPPSTASADVDSSPARRPDAVLSPGSQPDAGAGKHGQPEKRPDAGSPGALEKPALPHAPNPAVAEGAVSARETPTPAETGDQRAAQPGTAAGREKILEIHNTAILIPGNDAAESSPVKDAPACGAATGPSVSGESAGVFNRAVEKASVSSTPAGSRIDLLLRPEGLGRVAVRLLERGGGVEVAVRSDSQPAKSLLVDSLPSLVEGLRRHGWDITRTAAGGAESEQRGWSAGQQNQRGYEEKSRRQQAQGGTREDRDPAVLFSLGLP